MPTAVMAVDYPDVAGKAQAGRGRACWTDGAPRSPAGGDVMT